MRWHLNLEKSRPRIEPRLRAKLGVLRLAFESPDSSRVIKLRRLFKFPYIHSQSCHILILLNNVVSAIA